MRTLVHLSDLHFDRIDTALIAPLIGTIEALQPDLVVVSGDLTQRARSMQFRQARAFLDALPQPQLVVPGNHDIPMHDVFGRFFQPLDKYRRFITDDLAPVFVDQEIAVFGLNTARSLTIKNGKISQSQLALLQKRLDAVDTDVIKIVATHHPVDLPIHRGGNDLVGRAPRAIEHFVRGGIDMLLAGHVHTSSTGTTAQRYPGTEAAVLVVQAGTATSTRGRGESNSFNVIRVDRTRIVVNCHSWSPEQNCFIESMTQSFGRDGPHWVSEEPSPGSLSAK